MHWISIGRNNGTISCSNETTPSGKSPLAIAQSPWGLRLGSFVHPLLEFSDFLLRPRTTVALRRHMSCRHRAIDGGLVRFDVVVAPKIEHALLVEHVILVNGIEKRLNIFSVAKGHSGEILPAIRRRVKAIIPSACGTAGELSDYRQV